MSFKWDAAPPKSKQNLPSIRGIEANLRRQAAEEASKIYKTFYHENVDPYTLIINVAHDVQHGQHESCAVIDGTITILENVIVDRELVFGDGRVVEKSTTGLVLRIRDSIKPGLYELDVQLHTCSDDNVTIDSDMLRCSTSIQARWRDE